MSGGVLSDFGGGGGRGGVPKVYSRRDPWNVANCFVWCYSYMLTFGRSVEAMNSAPILVIVTMVLSVWEADTQYTKMRRRRRRRRSSELRSTYPSNQNAIKSQILTDFCKVTHSPAIAWAIFRELDNVKCLSQSPLIFLASFGEKEKISHECNLPQGPLSSAERFLWLRCNHDRCPSSRICC